VIWGFIAWEQDGVLSLGVERTGPFGPPKESASTRADMQVSPSFLPRHLLSSQVIILMPLCSPNQLQSPSSFLDGTSFTIYKPSSISHYDYSFFSLIKHGDAKSRTTGLTFLGHTSLGGEHDNSNPRFMYSSQSLTILYQPRGN
jgi:hypothetical protein